MNNSDLVSAEAGRLSRGLFEVFCAVRDLPRTQPVTAARIGAQIDRTAVAVGLSLKRLEDMGLVRRDGDKRPQEYIVAPDPSRVRVPTYRPKKTNRKTEMGSDGLTAAQRDILAVIQQMMAEDESESGIAFGAVTARTGLPSGAVIGRIEGLMKKGFVRVWSTDRAEGRTRRMVAPIENTEPAAVWVPKSRLSEQFGYAPLKSRAAEAALYGEARYEDLPRSQRKADMINTPVPPRAHNFSQIQWSGA